MIKTSVVHHKEKQWIKIEFPYNSSVAAKIKRIDNSTWSRTHQAWLIPNTQASIRQFDIHFPENQISDDIQNVQSISYHTKEKKSEKEIIRLDINGKLLILKIPKNEKDISFLRTLRYSKWNMEKYHWEIPNYQGNLELIEAYFNNRIDEIIKHTGLSVNIKQDESRNDRQNELHIIHTKTGRLKLIFGFDRELMLLIKKFPYNFWDAQNRWWTIPYSENYLIEIKQYAASKAWNVIYEEEKLAKDGVKKINAFDIPNYRICPEEMILKLREIRYSEKTIKTYKGLFEEFINFYYKFEINTISEQQIIAFVRYLVMERKVSTSYQNQAINAIKFYYEKVLGGQRKFYFIDRPKREHTLPTVLNEEEIKLLFNAVVNIKHKCMLMLAYSAGLRLGEIIRLRMSDIDRERMQIRVTQSKGKKDRYTKLSLKFLSVFDKYAEEYKPKDYAFEGVNGVEYSPSSLQNIIRAATLKAGITKRCTMHTLRHTFATHSLENGVDLRYIQSMMGHESSKTTEIYTHITTKGFDQIKSPLDNLDI